MKRTSSRRARAIGAGRWSAGATTLSLLALSACREPVELGRASRPLALDDIDSQLRYAEQQILKTENRLEVTAHPRFTGADFAGGTWMTGDTRDWRSGFFTGSEWLMYEAFGTSAWLAHASARTADFADEVSRPQTHDVGFKTLASYGNGFRLTSVEDYRPKIFAGANTLADRFMPEYGVTRSWNDPPGGNVRVIVDNMMNLELLYLAAELTSTEADRDRWLEIAVQHAVNTEANQVRDSADPDIDGSTCHVFFYNLGECRTHQGLSADSTWSRGQAWAMYGFTMSYQNARRYPTYAGEAALFLATAQRTSDLYLRRLAEPIHQDWIPLHDFDQPDPAGPKDSSAAAIAAAALIELSRIPAVEASKRAEYRAAAEAMLHDLLAPESTYRTFASASELGAETILLRATSSFSTAGGGVRDVERGLSYADYYVIEALLRYRDTYGPSPAAPRFLSGKRQAGGIALAWTPTRGAVRYTVERARKPGGPYAEIARTTEPRHVDSTARPDRTYYYVVTATNSASPAAESARSNRAVVRPASCEWACALAP